MLLIFVCMKKKRCITRKMEREKDESNEIYGGGQSRREGIRFTV